MSMYGIRCEIITEWIRKRAHHLECGDGQWGSKVADFVRGGPYTHAANVKLSAACWQQAHAECLAYLSGEPIPDGKDVLADVLVWFGSRHDGEEGAGGDLPDIDVSRHERRAVRR